MTEDGKFAAEMLSYTPAIVPRKLQFSRFLNLPGEVRNQIYDWVLVDTDPVMPSDWIGYNCRCRRLSRNSRWGPKMSRPYWPSLAVVCQQLRNEFGPRFMNVVEQWVELSDAEQFIHTFFPDSNVQTCQGTFFICVSGVESPLKPWRVDVLPVIKLLHLKKHVQCHFRASEDAEGLELLVSSIKNSWKEYVNTALARLELEIKTHYHWAGNRFSSKHINLVFKETERLSWQNGKAYTRRGIRLKRFVEEVGLAEMGGWNVGVGVAWDFAKKREGLRPST